MLRECFEKHKEKERKGQPQAQAQAQALAEEMIPNALVEVQKLSHVAYQLKGQMRAVPGFFALSLLSVGAAATNRSLLAVGSSSSCGPGASVSSPSGKNAGVS